MVKKIITFSVQYTTTITYEENEVDGEDDAIADIDIPENDSTKYKRNSFEIVKVECPRDQFTVEYVRDEYGELPCKPNK